MNNQYAEFILSKQRNRILLIILLLTAGCYQIAQSQHKTVAVKSGEKLFEEQISQQLEGMGNHQFEISTDNEWAHTYFNKALALTYGPEREPQGTHAEQFDFILSRMFNTSN